MSKSEWVFRLACPNDAELFAKWAATNTQIDPKDVLATLKENNPTTVFFVAEKNGTPIVFAPVYLTAMLAHLGINPEARGSEVLKALEFITDAVTGWFAQIGIREIQTLTKPAYGLAKWAEKHQFETDDRILYRRNINTLLETPEVKTSLPDMCQEAI